jgi:prepilin-type N-terminal cleavage/methylation domain-containing protein
MGRRGFTLVEMMVVIAIIAILAALLIPAIGMAVRAGKSGAMYAEMDTLAMSIEAYKTKTSDYPPDFTDLAAVVAHIKKAYPRTPPALLASITANWANPSYALPDGRCPAKLDPAESIVFWLGMLKNDPRNPLFSVVAPVPASGAADPREPFSYFDFKKEQLTGPLFLSAVGQPYTDLDSDGWPEYVPKQAPKAPFVYFDGRVLGGGYIYGKAAYTSLSAVAGEVRPYRSNSPIDSLDNKKTIPGTTDNPTLWIDPNKFQLIGAGLDGVYGGTFSPDPNASGFPIFKQFPKPNYSMTPEETDNIASFASGRTIGDSVP